MIIKVCGMRDPQNIREVARLDIDWMGFIFYPGSPRYAGGGEACLTVCGERCPKRVGVFVNASFEEIRETASRCRLDYLQLHGDETPGECHALRKRGYAIIKALHVSCADDLRAASGYEDYADYLLFDTRCDGYGGSGQAFDRSLLEYYRGGTPFILSGGIRPDSAEAILRLRHPRMAGIDLNSGFETAPGVKDVARLRQFIRLVRNDNVKPAY